MNDANRSAAEPQSDMNSPTIASPAVTSPGALLRGVREAASVSVEALAGAMKVPVNKIEALESDNYAALPDVVFARALAASICRVFATSPAPVLALMPKGGAHSLSSTGADINASFRDGSERPRRNSFVTNATRPLGVAVLVLLLGAVVFVFLPYRSDAPESSDTSTGMVTYEPAVNQDIPLDTELPSEPLVGALTLPPSVPSQAQQMPIATEPLVAESAVAPDAGGMIEFTARAPSWVQVSDASKKVVFQRTLAKGEMASAAGTPPLRVVVGRSEDVDIKVRGAELDRAGIAKSGVARFEVQ